MEWAEIDDTFSQPFTLSEDEAAYVPTQILAELFKDAGYDAIAYRSHFNKAGRSIAILNVSNARILACAPHTVSTVEVLHRQIGNAWLSEAVTETVGALESRESSCFALAQE